MERIAKNLFLLIISIIFALLLAEVIFYLVPSLREKYAFRCFVSDSDSQFSSNFSLSEWRHSKIVGFERVPNCDSNVNSFGLIGEEFNINKDKNIFRILVLGDSIIAHNHIIEYLKKMLNNSTSEIKFEVINAGVQGYDIWQNANFLKYKGIQFNPDIVIVSVCLGSFSPRNVTYSKIGKKFMVLTVPSNRLLEVISINGTFFRKSYLYRFFILELGKIMGHSENYTLKDTGIYYMGLIKETCLDHQIPFFAFIWPFLIPRQEYDSKTKYAYSTILDVLGDLKIDYIDLHKYFPNKGIRGLRCSKYDFVHPSKEGHKIAAKIVFKHLVDNYRIW